MFRFKSEFGQIWATTFNFMLYLGRLLMLLIVWERWKRRRFSETKMWMVVDGTGGG